VEQACAGDPELKLRVEELLESDECASSLFRLLVLGDWTAAELPAHIRRYRILSLPGEGSGGEGVGSSLP